MTYDIHIDRYKPLSVIEPSVGGTGWGSVITSILEVNYTEETLKIQLGGAVSTTTLDVYVLYIKV